MSTALATLPWVESDSIQANRDKRQVKFKVKDKTKFDMTALQKALSEQGYDNAKLMTGPTDS